MKMTVDPDRPRLAITPGYWDQVMDIIAWILLTGLIGFAAYLFVVTNRSGNMDAISGIMILTILGIASVIGIHFLKRYPHRFNYLVLITPENALRQYTLAVRMMRMINLTILVEFILILVTIYLEAIKGRQIDVGLIVVFVIILGFLPVGYYFWKSSGKR